MPQQAQVSSVDAIESFRSSLIVFLSKARPALEEVSSEVIRLRQWLQHDQRRYWEKELRIRARRLEEARQQLFEAKLSQLEHGSALQFMAVQRTQRAVRDAEAKLAMLKKWDRDLDQRTEPLAKQVEQTHGFLTSDMAKAVAHLAEIVKVLDSYASVLPPSRPTAPSATSNAQTPESPASTATVNTMEKTP